MKGWMSGAGRPRTNWEPEQEASRFHVGTKEGDLEFHESIRESAR